MARKFFDRNRGNFAQDKFLYFFLPPSFWAEVRLSFLMQLSGE